jgi:peptide deformylase
MNDKILKYPDPFLETKATIVDNVNTILVQSEIEYMTKIMEEIKDGLGLASIQVGIKNSIILYREGGNPKHDLQVLINAKISCVLDSNLQRSEEGCFSLPGIFIPLRRYKKIEVVGLNENGGDVRIVSEGMLSNVLQHEIDHLNGILMIDRLSRLQKNMFKRRLKGMKFTARSV